MGNGAASRPPRFPLSAAAVDRCVAVQQFLPKASLGHANPVIPSRHGGKIVDNEDAMVFVLS